MTNKNFHNVVHNVENHIHLPPTDNKSKTKRSNPRNNRWLWTLVIVPIIVALIKYDKIFPTKNEKEKVENVCDYLRQQISLKSKELENIKNLLLTTPKDDYLRLSSDSMSHAIQINQLNTQLKENKCVN